MSDDLLPPPDESGDAGFDVVMRGYNRRQVEDYIERVEIALADADRQHQQDLAEVEAAKQELSQVRAKLIEAERRAEGQPEPSSLVGERLLTMLRLAEQEAEEIVEKGHQRAAANTADLQASLERREAEVTQAMIDAEQARLEAQRDADAVRAKAHQDAEALWAKAKAEVEALWAKAQAETAEFAAQAEQDAGSMRARVEREAEDLLEDARRQADRTLSAAHADADLVLQQAHAQAEATLEAASRDAAALDGQAREQATRMVADASKQVEELQRQRDTISAQLAALRESVRGTTESTPPDFR